MTHLCSEGAAQHTTQARSSPIRKQRSVGRRTFVPLFVCSAVFLIVGAQAVWAGVNVWTTHGPYGGTVEALAIDPITPTTVYAVMSGGGVIKRTNGGSVWIFTNGVKAVAIDSQMPSTLYAGTDSNGVLRSTDGGTTWSPVNSGLPSLHIQTLAIDPNTPSTLYAGTDVGVFRSTNSGVSWSGINTGLPGPNPSQGPGVFAFAIAPSTPSTLYASIGGGVYRSTDSGGHWSATSLPYSYSEPQVTYYWSFNALAVDATNPRTVYAGISKGQWLVVPDGIVASAYRSTDGGVSWAAADTGLPRAGVNALAVAPDASTTVYAATGQPGVAGGGVYRSIDRGVSWSLIGAIWQINALVIDPTPPTTVYAGSDGAGVLQSIDGGTSWEAIGGTVRPIKALAAAPTTPSTMYAGTDGGVFRSANGGASWTAINAGLPGPNLVEGPAVLTLTLDPSAPNTLYVGTTSGVFKSTDSGIGWSDASTGLPDPNREPWGLVTALTIDPVTPSTLYAGTSAGVYRSVNGGIEWTPVSGGFPSAVGGVNALVIDPRTASTLYLAAAAVCTSCCGIPPSCSGGGVFKSTDSGANWTAINSGLPANASATALAIDPAMPSTLYAGTACVMLYSTACGVFLSTDSGGSWTAVDTGLSNTTVRALTIDPLTPSTLYAGTTSGVFYSINSGDGWSVVNRGLSGDASTVSALAIDPNAPSTLYAGTDGGVFDIELTCVVGTGTSDSCTESALDACLPGGANFTGAVTFDCGPDPATITVTSTKRIAQDTSIDGGNLITLSGGNSVGVFENDGVTFTVQNLTIANGRAMNGGGISNGGTLTVTNSTFSGNRASSYGGGIFNDATGTVIVTNSTFSTNTATSYGGAIWNSSLGPNGNGAVTVTNSTFSHNSASEYSGGAIGNNSTLTVTNSTFSDNRANGGGAIRNINNGTLSVTNSTFSDNSGGDILNSGNLGIGTVRVTNSTFSGNSGSAIVNGGSGTVSVSKSTFSGSGSSVGTSNVGTFVVTDSTVSGFYSGMLNAGTLVVTNSTVSGNGSGISNRICSSVGCLDGGTLTVTNTVIANNTNGGDCIRSAAVVNDGGHNLIDDAANSCGLMNGENGNLVGVDPKLDPAGLKDNGGPTQTIALEPNSPAINAGDADVCATAPVNGIDQRGYVRPGTGSTACSIGAYEYNSPGPPPLCPGDCGGNGVVTIEELVTLVDVVLGTAQPSACPHGIPNGMEVTVAFIIRAVNAALNDCTDPAAACVASGGLVTEVECYCIETPDFFNTCGVGACTCSPTGEPRQLNSCDCGSGQCWNGSACVERVGQ